MNYELSINKAGTDNMFPYPLKLTEDLVVTFCKAPRTFKDVGLKRFYPNDRHSWSRAEESDLCETTGTWHIGLEYMTIDARNDNVFRNSEGRHRAFATYKENGKPKYISIPTKSGSKWALSKNYNWTVSRLADISQGDEINVATQFDLPHHVNRTLNRYGGNWLIWLRARLMYEQYRTSFVSNVIRYEF